MPFKCSYCQHSPNDNGWRTEGKCKLTADNIAAAKSVLSQRFPENALTIAALEVEANSTLCYVCLPEELDALLRVPSRGAARADPARPK